MASADVPRASEVSCGYCLQSVEVLEDPRTLPCTHICCMECLEADFRKLNTTECPVCKATHEHPVTDFSKYASVPDDGTQQKEKSDDDNDDAKGKKHQAEACENHPHNALSIACTECYYLFCDSCDLQTLCDLIRRPDGSITYSLHKPHRIASIIETVAKHTDTLCVKVTEISSKEKELLKALSDHEALVDEEISKVEQRRNEEVRKLEEFKEHCNHMVDLTLVQSAMEKEEKNKVWTSVQQVLRRESDGDVVRRHKELTTKLTEATDSLNTQFDVLLPPVPLQRTETTELTGAAEASNTDIDIAQLLPLLLEAQGSLKKCSFPPLIDEITMVAYDDDIYAATFCNGDLYWATREEIFKSNGDSCQRSTMTIQSLKFYKDCFVVLEVKDSDRSTFITMLHKNSRTKLHDKKQLFSFKRCDKSHSHLDISELYRYVVTVDPKEKKLVHYDMQRKEVNNWSLYRMKKPLGVHILSKDYVLISDNHGHSVSKIFLGGSSYFPDDIWTCDRLIHPTGICSDPITGLIYVGSYTEKCVYIISPKGDLVNTFDTDDFTHITDVAISADKLAVCSKSMGLRTYPINKEFCLACQ